LQAFSYRSELVDIHRQCNIHILGSAVVVNPHAVGGGTNDDSIYTGILAGLLQLAHGFDLLRQ
jgi:hypothetical protein